MSVADLPRPMGYVFGGGGSLGAVQVGMLQALGEHDIAPDLVTGTSVGSVNGAVVALDPESAANRLSHVWARVTRERVLPGGLLAQVRTLQHTKTHLFPSTGLAAVITDVLGADITFADLTVPFAAIATDIATARPQVLREGHVLPALLASAAIPGVFPPVRINGRDLMDGGVVNKTPVSHAVALGADRVWVLPTGYSCDLPASPKTAVNMALHAMTLAVNHRLAERFEQAVDLRVIRPLCPVATSGADFSHAATPIERSHAATREWLAGRPPSTGQAGLLAPHRH